MGLISKDVNQQLDGLIGKAFAINRMLDRGVSLLLVRWKMINASKILHEKAAHVYPSATFADSISDYQGLRDMESIYPATPIGNKEYASPLEFIQDYHKENLEFEEMIKDAIDAASDDGDYATKKFLDGLLMRLVPYTALSNDLVSIFIQYGNDAFHLQQLDAVIEKYITVA